MGSQNDETLSHATGSSGGDFADGRATPSSAAGTRPSTSHGRSSIAATSTSAQEDERQRPPLPPRPSRTVDPIDRPARSRTNTLQLPKRASRPQLQAGATTALSLTDIHTQTYPDDSRETYAQSTLSTPSRKSHRGVSPGGNIKGLYGSDVDDAASVLSSIPGHSVGFDAESILGDFLVTDSKNPVQGGPDGTPQKAELLEMVPYDMSEPTADFSREFDEIEGMEADGSNEGIFSCT